MDTGGMTQAEAAEGFRRFAEPLRGNAESWTPVPNPELKVGDTVTVINAAGERQAMRVTSVVPTEGQEPGELRVVYGRRVSLV